MLFLCQKCNLYLLPFSSVPFKSKSICNQTSTSTILNCHNPHSQDAPDEHHHSPVHRKHNSKSTNFFLQNLSQNNQNQQQLTASQKIELEEHPIMPHQEKVKLLELSLVRKRTPQFPGSIYVQSPSDSDVGSSLPPIRNLFQSSVDNDGDGGGGGGDGHVDEEEEEMIMRAVEIRRKVTLEIFKEAMMKEGRFGITYTTNLANRLQGFLDYVMIEAASLKRMPEYYNSSFNLRSKAVIEDSQVVPLIRWLKHNELSYPQISKLILLSRGRIDLIRDRVQWLKSNHVKGEFLGVALVKGGENILHRSYKELDEIVEYLVSNGVRRDWVGYVISRCPQLLSYSLEEVKTRVAFYVDMGMNEKDFGTMVFDFPRALGYLTMEEMNQKVNYLKEFGLKNEDVGKLLAFRPQLMGCSIEEQWKPLVKYFYYYGITKDGMRRMLTLKPMVFCTDLKLNIVPKDIGVRDDAVGNMLVKFPTLLTYSLNKKIRPVVIFLMTKAGVTEKDIAKVVALGPELLGCSIVQKLEVNVKYFLSLGIHVRQLGEMVADFPLLLRYNPDVLRPKYVYLRRTMIRPLQDIIEFPRFFSYSLEGRIIPRHKVLVENQLNIKLRYMLASSDVQFNKLVNDLIRKRKKFQSGVAGDEEEETQSSEEEEETQSEAVIPVDTTTKLQT
ncbi:transcription termination factor MTERF2, chloroplastic isoform X2 [Arachis hypogaea]|uniref:transcription termination factor MTERF2, chloroplastic isoform X2 n=1 Tax=Arachis hypogaea TaxID=3818 RepID=UPI000DEC717A|nr:transcription termination factor MTERF2, chloroplastic isoform X2 [Arachis hypogaea]